MQIHLIRSLRLIHIFQIIYWSVSFCFVFEVELLVKIKNLLQNQKKAFQQEWDIKIDNIKQKETDQ
jgi:hypothetical protein